MSQALRFSVVIPHRNGSATLLATLAALEPALDRTRDEVILVDNGSTDDSLPRVAAEYPRTVIIHNPCNNGFGRACNQGIARARGEFLLILNNDALVPEGVLDEFARQFAALPRAALLAPQLVGPDGARQRSFGWFPDFASETGIGRKRRPPQPEGAAPRRVETVVGACMAVRRAAIDQAGAFDPAFFFYFEETEWCHRLQSHGWEVWLLPGLAVVHGKGVSTRPLRRGAQVEMLRSRLLYYRKVFPAGLALLLTLWRGLRLALNTLTATLLLLLTLGLAPRLRERWATYATQLAWLLLGRPQAWGLPDKCPR